MAQGGDAYFNVIVFRDEKDGEKHKRKYKALMIMEIVSTRYVDDSCLRTLGLYDSVHWMINMLGLSHFYARKDPTYIRLTLEFLSSLIYTTKIMTASTVGTVSFHIFNKEYQFSLDQVTDLLQ